MNTKQAKEIKIADYLHTLGFEPKKIQGEIFWYNSPLRNEQTPSFKVDNRLNIWYDHGLGKGGNIIDLVMALHNLSSVSDALIHLNKQKPNSSFFNSNTSYTGKDRQQVEATITILKVVPITNKALMDYLIERKINLDVAKEYCKEIYYTVNGKSYFAIGFQNDIGGYILRNKYAKVCTSSDITTYSNIDTNKEICLVFEGFMDYLSYLTMKNLDQPKVEAVILNSTSNLPKALYFIQSHSKVYTYLDNDEGGRKATHIINNVCKSHINKSVEYAKYEDLNDYLCDKKLEQKEVLKRKPTRGFKM